MGRAAKAWRAPNVLQLLLPIEFSFRITNTLFSHTFLNLYMPHYLRLCIISLFFLYGVASLCHSAPEFDVSELESLFSATVPKPADLGKAGGRRKSVGSKTDKVNLVI
jgi:formin 2